MLSGVCASSGAGSYRYIFFYRCSTGLTCTPPCSLWYGVWHTNSIGTSASNLRAVRADYFNSFSVYMTICSSSFSDSYELKKNCLFCPWMYIWRTHSVHTMSPSGKKKGRCYCKFCPDFCPQWRRYNPLSLLVIIQYQTQHPPFTVWFCIRVESLFTEILIETVRCK